MAKGFALKESRTRLLAYANMGIGLVLFFWILVMVRDLVSFPLKQQTGAWEPRKKMGEATPRRPFQDYAVILEKNPFGLPGGPLKMISPSPSSPSEEKRASRGNLTLIGTVSGSGNRDFAIFLDPSGTHEVFALGDSVFGMGMLKQVLRDKAVIVKDGRPIEIPLIDSLSLKGLLSSPPGAGEDDIAAGVQPAGSASYVLNQQVLQRAIENPNQIMTQARLLPYVMQGKVQGFVLSEVRPGGIYESLGLQNGDVLLRINEYDISTPESALRAFTALKGTDLVELDVLRKGAPLTLTYEIR
ncbi:MAG: type II secretion system protein GspC [candidate division NC10 bacterium]|nr:type II secretion system protein GspC [candidate division NC10 bacterium]